MILIVGLFATAAVADDRITVANRAMSHHELGAGGIRELPDRFSRVVLVLDDCDRVPADGRVQIAEAFRTIHADRAGGPTRFLHFASWGP